MKNILREVIEKFEERKKCLEIEFSSDEWRNTIPSESGLYVIKTKTPVGVLRKLPGPEGEAHYNLRKRIEINSLDGSNELLITQKENEFYAVYNGHAKNLKSRARSHYRGHNKTACLALRQYEALHDYEWLFCFLAVSSFKNNSLDNKLLRVASEQAWRSEFGWPVLCKG